MKRFAGWLLALTMLGALTGCAQNDEPVASVTPSALAPGEEATEIIEGGMYTAKNDVVAYIQAFGKLPDNYITQEQAQQLGWTGGSLDEVAPDMSIGGNRYHNRDGKLPHKQGRLYYECDIDTHHAQGRGHKRVIYSNDGLIYYTDNEYASFEQVSDGTGWKHHHNYHHGVQTATPSPSQPQ